MSWVGGPKFHMVRRGSKQGRAGGAHSEPCGRRKTRFLPALMRNLEAAYKARGVKTAVGKVDPKKG